MTPRPSAGSMTPRSATPLTAGTLQPEGHVMRAASLNSPPPHSLLGSGGLTARSLSEHSAAAPAHAHAAHTTTSRGPRPGGDVCGTPTTPPLVAPSPLLAPLLVPRPMPPSAPSPSAPLEREMSDQRLSDPRLSDSGTAPAESVDGTASHLKAPLLVTHCPPGAQHSGGHPSASHALATTPSHPGTCPTPSNRRTPAGATPAEHHEAPVHRRSSSQPTHAPWQVSMPAGA